jgi:quercetin dioxygenase-like cupin family protein
MQRRSQWIGFCVGLAIALASLAVSAQERHHSVVPPDSVQWKPAPPSLPKGAEFAILYGDPAKDGLFAMRLKLPKGYKVAAHHHPRPEIVTVISGAIRLATFEDDRETEERLSTGTFLSMPPGMIHKAVAEEETVLQLNSFGPWEVVYVNPAGDPRKATQ